MAVPRCQPYRSLVWNSLLLLLLLMMLLLLLLLLPLLLAPDRQGEQPPPPTPTPGPGRPVCGPVAGHGKEATVLLPTDN